MICFPLDNTPYEAKDMGTYLATRTRGVFSSDGNLAVTPGESGLSVSVSPGLAWLKWSDYWGTAALQEQALTLDLDTADGALKRIDAIVCRLDKVNNRAEIVVKKGAPSSAPIVVPPVRDANYDELYIATVLIGAGVISISASAITDQRLNEEYCGLMRDGVTGIPTASLHAQAQQILTELTDALNAQIVRQSAEFDAWFDDLKGKLGEDPATALQQQVDNLNAAVVGDAFQASGTPVSIAYAGAQRIASITAYGENAQGGTTEAPVALTGVDSVFVSGNNLLPKAVRTETTGGITFTPNPDGSILVSGTATTNVGYSYAHFERALLGRTVCLSGGSTQAQVLINERLSSGAFVRNVLVDRGQGVSGILTKQKEDNILYATIQVLAGTTVNTTIYPMLNLGESPLPYEPYQGRVTPLPIPRPLRRVGDVKDKCVTRQDYESAEKLVVTYNVGFVELDGTEASHLYEGMFYLDYSASWPTPANRVNGVCSHYPYGAYGKGKIGLTDNGAAVVYNPNGDYTGDEGGLANWKAYLAAQKEAGTPVQVAYQLAAPEVYATDPLTIDNAAGPLNVMTGGELEVRMTELVGSRTYDADGDGVVDEAEKVSNALTLKNAAGEVVATFDGSEAAILQLTAALVGALGKTEKAADSSKLAGLTPVVDNPGPNNRNTWYFPFTGTNNRDGARKYYAALYADEATRAANKVGGGALVDTNDGRLSNARRASNITMGYDGNLWISYS